MDDYTDKDQAEEKKAPKPEASKPVAAPKVGPTFYRGPDGGKLTTTKPAEESDSK